MICRQILKGKFPATSFVKRDLKPGFAVSSNIQIFGIKYSNIWNKIFKYSNIKRKNSNFQILKGKFAATSFVNRDLKPVFAVSSIFKYWKSWGPGSDF